MREIRGIFDRYTKHSFDTAKHILSLIGALLNTYLNVELVNDAVNKHAFHVLFLCLCLSSLFATIDSYTINDYYSAPSTFAVRPMTSVTSSTITQTSGKQYIFYLHNTIFKLIVIQIEIDECNEYR